MRSDYTDKVTKESSGGLGFPGLVTASLVMLLCIAAVVHAQARTEPAPLDRFAYSEYASAQGAAATLLPDGSALSLSGVEGAEVRGPSGAKPLKLAYTRTGATATVLPDGSVLVFGGIGPDGKLVETSELLAPQTLISTKLSDSDLVARAYHSATLLTDGTVLIVGGSRHGEALKTAEIWDPRTHKVVLSGIRSEAAHVSHDAALLADGRVLIWAVQSGSNAMKTAEVFDPVTDKFSMASTASLPSQSLSDRAPTVEASIPASGAKDVAVDGVLSLRFSEPLQVSSVNASTVTLVGPDGAVEGKVTAAESGMLLFFSPHMDLMPETTYTLFLKGLVDYTGRSLAPFTTVNFTTRGFGDEKSKGMAAVGTSETGDHTTMSGTGASFSVAGGALSSNSNLGKQTQSSEDKTTSNSYSESENPEDWVPGPQHRHGAWRILGMKGEPRADLEPTKVAALTAPRDTTAVSGRVLRLNQQPLAGVTISIGAKSTTTDSEGRFLLSGVVAGPQQMLVDGTRTFSGGRQYGQYPLYVEPKKGETTSLSAIYMARIDPADEVTIPSPTKQEVVLTHPAIPGLEVHIPAGVVIRDRNGKIVTKLSITPLPVDRTPVPAPPGYPPVYFTLQPAGAVVESVDPSKPKGIKIVYPNYLNAPAGQIATFWNYDPHSGGWQVYGQGDVSPDGKQVVPHADAFQRTIMPYGYVVNNTNPPPNGPPPNGCQKGGDPVDCATGLFLNTETDLSIKDVMPISVTRTYRQNDNVSRSFGIGTNLSYNMYLYTTGTTAPYPTIYLILPDGGRVLYTLVSGVTYANAIYKASNTPTMFEGSILSPDVTSTQFNLTLSDQTVFVFAHDAPNQLQAIKDKNGNTVKVNLANVTSGNIMQVMSPNGRYINFTYDANNRITAATDNIGRTVTYAYDTAGRLQTVTDPLTHTESYTYDTSNNLLTITDKRRNTAVTNTYDANNRVATQTLADGAFWQFNYTLSGGNVTQTAITDPLNHVRVIAFNSSGYATQEVQASGDPLQRTYAYQRDSANEINKSTDPLGRVTVISYDGYNHVSSQTLLSGTPNSITETFNYNSFIGEPFEYVDPLGHFSQYFYDSLGNLTKVIDPLNHSTIVANNVQGQPITLTDALGKITQITYAQGDVSSVTDPLGRTTNVFTDGVGRVINYTDAAGDSSSYTYDAMDRLTQIVDANGGTTTMTYDENGNLLTKTDPRNNTYSYTYDGRNRVQTFMDPLGKTENYAYDGLGHLTSYTDRKLQARTYAYDSLNRLSTISYPDSTTATFTWDAADRLTQITNSATGTIGWTYDGLDDVLTETDPNGGITYTYDKAGRRTQMQVSGQPNPIVYGYDNANKLTSVTQGTQVVSLGYDNDNRRTTLTLANGVIGTYGYDDAGEITGLTYAKGSTTVGGLTYTYDPTGRMASQSGSLIGGVLTPSVSSASYDANNRLTQWGSSTLTYDDNGNLASDSSNIYGWDVRNQLISITGAHAASFAYDPIGRRQSATIDGNSTGYLYDQQTVVQELSGTTPVANYLTGLYSEEVFQRSTSAGNRAPLIGIPGSILALTDDSGVVQTSYSYVPFGDVTSSGATDTNPMQFAGQQSDTTGLTYLRARYYNPTYDRFISSDPIGLQGGLNTYTYSDDDPIGETDPSGLSGGPYHPPKGVGFRCYMSDSCPAIKGKIWLIIRMIESHEGWDKVAGMPRHSKEIADLYGALTRCMNYYDRKCKDCKPDGMPEIAPEPQANSNWNPNWGVIGTGAFVGGVILAGFFFGPEVWPAAAAAP